MLMCPSLCCMHHQSPEENTCVAGHAAGDKDNEWAAPTDKEKENVGNEANVVKGAHHTAKPLTCSLANMPVLHGSAGHAGSENADDEDAELLALL